MKFKNAMTCAEAHPGLCVKKHAWAILQVRAAARALQMLLHECEAGEFWRLQIVSKEAGTLLLPHWVLISSTVAKYVALASVLRNCPNSHPFVMRL